MALRTERHSARMSKIKNGGLDQYGTKPFEQQQFGMLKGLMVRLTAAFIQECVNVFVLMACDRHHLV